MVSTTPIRKEFSMFIIHQDICQSPLIKWRSLITIGSSPQVRVNNILRRQQGKSTQIDRKKNAKTSNQFWCCHRFPQVVSISIMIDFSPPFLNPDSVGSQFLKAVRVDSTLMIHGTNALPMVARHAVPAGLNANHGDLKMVKQSRFSFYIHAFTCIYRDFFNLESWHLRIPMENQKIPQILSSKSFWPMN